MIQRVAVLFLLLSFQSVYAKKEVAVVKKRSLAQEYILLIEDTVHRLESEDQGYKVSFKLKAAIYHLRKDSNKFEENLRLLQASKESEGRIKVKAHPDTLEIVSIEKEP